MTVGAGCPVSTALQSLRPCIPRCSVQCALPATHLHAVSPPSLPDPPVLVNIDYFLLVAITAWEQQFLKVGSVCTCLSPLTLSAWMSRAPLLTPGPQDVHRTHSPTPACLFFRAAQIMSQVTLLTHSLIHSLSLSLSLSLIHVHSLAPLLLCPPQLRDEKRVFFKYWAEKHLLILRSSKRFRLLPPFLGSRTQHTFPHFTDREVAMLWARVRELHPGFEHYTMGALQSRLMVDLPFQDFASSLKWTVPRWVGSPARHTAFGIQRPSRVTWGGE